MGCIIRENNQPVRYRFSGNNPILFNDPSGAMKQYTESGMGPRREAPTIYANWRTEPQWLTDAWNDYWSDPFESAR